MHECFSGESFEIFDSICCEMMRIVGCRSRGHAMTSQPLELPFETVGKKYEGEFCHGHLIIKKREIGEEERNNKTRVAQRRVTRLSHDVNTSAAAACSRYTLIRSVARIPSLPGSPRRPPLPPPALPPPPSPPPHCPPVATLRNLLTRSASPVLPNLPQPLFAAYHRAREGRMSGR